MQELCVHFIHCLHFKTGIYILAISPPGGVFLSKLKNREEFEGGLEKRKGKEGKRKKKKSKNTFMKLKNRKKNPQKQGRI